MAIISIYKPPKGALLAAVSLGFISVGAAAEDPEVTLYKEAQHVYCLRDGKVALDRDPVFRLKVSKTSMTEEYLYRDGRVGAYKTLFRIRPDQVDCTVSPSESEDAKPYHAFEGLNELRCTDNEIPIVASVLTENLVERGTDTALIYEYRIHNGPPAKQTVVLSPDGAKCMVRFVRMADNEKPAD